MRCEVCKAFWPMNAFMLTRMIGEPDACDDCRPASDAALRVVGIFNMPGVPSCIKSGLCDLLEEATKVSGLKVPDIWIFTEPGPPQFNVVKIAEMFQSPAMRDMFQLPSTAEHWTQKGLKTSDKKPREPKPQSRLRRLREQLERLEQVPENEAVAFKLETEIYRLAHQEISEEWPEFIEEENHA